MRRARYTAAALALAWAPASALGQSRLSVRAEASAGPLTEGSPALDLTGRLGFDLHGPLSVQLSAAHRHFFPSQGDPSLNVVSGGLRYGPRLGAAGRLFADLNLGAAITRDQPKAYLSLDVGVGFEFALGPQATLGPVLRYSRLFASPRGLPDDAQAVTLGLAFTFGGTPPAARAVSAVPPVSDNDHEGLRSEQDAARDRDHDTVPDVTDACPDVPGAPSEIPARNGCPVGGVSMEASSEIPLLRPVFFEVGRDVIPTASLPAIDAVANALRASPGLRLLRVEGHADDALPAPRALALSQRRADAAVAWLVAYGVDAARLTTAAYGATRPLGRNWTAATRARFNRVEFVVVDPAPPDPPPRPICPYPVRDRDPSAGFFDAGVPDRDRDRVPDDTDRCPDVPAGGRPDAQCVGCPEWPMVP